MSGFKTSLEYSQQALQLVPADVSSQFNVAFVQFQIAQTIITLSEKDRTLEEVEEATRGLASAIETLEQIAKSEAPPFPRNDITSRANMGRNTMAKQLERARDKQAAYEEENASKLDQARKIREADIRRREDEKKAAEEAARERRRKIIEDQERIAQRDRELMDKRGEEERRRMEEDEDREQRKAERKARGPKPKRKKKDADSDTASDSDTLSRRRRTTQSGTEGLSDDDRPREKKKRKLARKNEPSGKFKSAEFVNDDDSDEPPAASGDDGVAAPRARKGRVVDDEDEEDEVGTAVPDMAEDEDE